MTKSLPTSHLADDNNSCITVLGAGSWGTALAITLARAGHPVRLWGHRFSHIQQLQQQRCNARYLPGIDFPAGLEPVATLDQAVKACSRFLVVVPSRVFIPVLGQLLALLPATENPVTVAWGTKGLHPDSGQLLSHVAATLFPEPAQLAIVSGPSFAREVALGKPVALAVAGSSMTATRQVASWLQTDSTRIYTNPDFIGVQLGGVVKNVIAIATGISDGLGLGANARAALITRGLSEIQRLGQVLDARPETFMGLAGLGDLVLTCTDDQSRNRRLGLGLGRGQTLARTVDDLGQAIEGLDNVQQLCKLAQQHTVELPITEQVRRVLFEDLAPMSAVSELLQRQPKSEMSGPQPEK